MAIWILAACLVAALVAVIGFWLALRRARARVLAFDEIVLSGRTRIRAAVDEATAAHIDEIRRVLARARADEASRLAAEERTLAEKRHADFMERSRRTAEAAADSLQTVERRLDEKLRSVAEDLDRAQLHLEAQLARLAQRQQQAIAEVETRLEAEATELGFTTDEQRKVVARLRDELERAASAAVTEALDELESQTVERRRAIEEITERLRARESAIAEGIERAETDARGRLEMTLVEFERRQTERIERVTEREIERHTQIATAAFEERMREIREDAAGRLARELDRAAQSLSREELIRRLDELS